MAQATRADLKAKWIQGYMPTKADYDEFFDSFFNMLSTEDKAELKTYFDTIYATPGDIPDVSSLLKLDQTTPQAVVNGSPIMEGIQFDITPSTSSAVEGLLRWNPTDRTLDLGLMDGLSTMQIGQELPLPAYNNTGVQIEEMTPVYISGRQGNLPEITPARSDSEATSRILGITTTTFGATGSSRNGLVTTFGYVRKIKTNYTGSGIWGTTWVTNDRLYVSKTVAGQLTNVEPTVPHHSDVVATVAIVGSVGIGSILVINEKHTSLQELTDVNGTPLTTDGQILNWHNTTQLFDFDKNINDYLPIQGITDSKGLTGFVDGDNINVAYNYTNRTITLTGNLDYYWRGIKGTLVSPWTSTAHTNTTGNWYLYSTGGTTFAWSNTVWSFSDLMVAAVKRGATNLLSFAIRETHKLMDSAAHKEFHSQIGTYKSSGGLLTAGTYIENTPTDIANTPGFDSAVLEDEDLQSVVTTWTEGTYTTAYVGASNLLVFDTTKTLPFHSTGAGAYLEINDPIAGTMTAGINNRYYNVYQIIVPACSDTDSQRYKMILLQPQVAYTDLASAQAENVASLKLGNFAALFTEFVIHARITYITASGDANAGKCRIATNGVTYVAGNKAGQVNVAGLVSTNHATLSNRGWLLSGHVGTANKLAAFNALGVTEEITHGEFKGTSTGKNIIAVANTSANDYTNTLPAKNGTIAMTSDIVPYFDATIGSSGADYTTLSAAYAAGKRNLKLISSITETSNTVITDYLNIYSTLNTNEINIGSYILQLTTDYVVVRFDNLSFKCINPSTYTFIQTVITSPTIYFSNCIISNLSTSNGKYIANGMYEKIYLNDCKVILGDYIGNYIKELTNTKTNYCEFVGGGTSCALISDTTAGGVHRNCVFTNNNFTGSWSTSNPIIRGLRGANISNISSSVACVFGAEDGSYEALISNMILINGFVFNRTNNLRLTNFEIKGFVSGFSSGIFINGKINTGITLTASNTFIGVTFTGAVTLNTNSNIFQDCIFSSTITGSGDYNKISNCIVTGLITLSSGAENNIITCNTLTGGLTDNSASATNIIKDNI